MDFETVLSRGGRLINIFSHAGLHAFQGIRAAHEVSAVYERLAREKGSDAITTEMFAEALKADPSTHPILDLILQYLPQILAILAMFFKFPIPVPTPTPTQAG